jgi:hypothetical protein
MHTAEPRETKWHKHSPTAAAIQVFQVPERLTASISRMSLLAVDTKEKRSSELASI